MKKLIYHWLIEIGHFLYYEGEDLNRMTLLEALKRFQWTKCRMKDYRYLTDYMMARKILWNI